MGGYTTIPKPLITSPPAPAPPPPPQSPVPEKPNLPMLYYGLVVVATAAFVLAVYNLIIVRWCATQYHRSTQQRHRRRNPTMSPPSPALSHGGSAVCLVSSFKYKKERDAGKKTPPEYSAGECSVCLSVFEDGEEVKKLPRCDHSFHASCIDMWLYSHFDCPLCRAPVVDLQPPATAPVSSGV